MVYLCFFEVKTEATMQQERGPPSIVHTRLRKEDDDADTLPVLINARGERPQRETYLVIDVFTGISPTLLRARGIDLTGYDNILRDRIDELAQRALKLLLEYVADERVDRVREPWRGDGRLRAVTTRRVWLTNPSKTLRFIKVLPPDDHDRPLPDLVQNLYWNCIVDNTYPQYDSEVVIHLSLRILHTSRVQLDLDMFNAALADSAPWQEMLGGARIQPLYYKKEQKMLNIPRPKAFFRLLPQERRNEMYDIYASKGNGEQLPAVALRPLRRSANPEDYYEYRVLLGEDAPYPPTDEDRDRAFDARQERGIALTYEEILRRQRSPSLAPTEIVTLPPLSPLLEPGTPPYVAPTPPPSPSLTPTEPTSPTSPVSDLAPTDILEDPPAQRMRLEVEEPTLQRTHMEYLPTGFRRLRSGRLVPVRRDTHTAAKRRKTR